MAHILYAENLRCGVMFAKAQGWHQASKNAFQKSDLSVVFIGTNVDPFRGAMIDTVYFAPCAEKLRDYDDIWALTKTRSRNVEFLKEL